MALSQGGWADAHGDDRLLLSVGRTWRIGPEPEYMCVWCSSDQGLERFDAWEREFTEGSADPFQTPFDLAARIARAGCYEPLVEPAAGTTGRYYSEAFDRTPGASREDVRRLYEERTRKRSGMQLNLLVERIGKLAPDPAGLAVWGLSDWRSVEAIARDLECDGPIQLVTSGLYADLGSEQL